MHHHGHHVTSAGQRIQLSGQHSVVRAVHQHALHERSKPALPGPNERQSARVKKLSNTIIFQPLATASRIANAIIGWCPALQCRHRAYRDVDARTTIWQTHAALPNAIVLARVLIVSLALCGLLRKGVALRRDFGHIICRVHLCCSGFDLLRRRHYFGWSVLRAHGRWSLACGRRATNTRPHRASGKQMLWPGSSTYCVARLGLAEREHRGSGRLLLKSEGNIENVDVHWCSLQRLLEQSNCSWNQQFNDLLVRINQVIRRSW
mmetsp:Transcript_38292/g.92044  ORF Transcript_38292/g.92044 Transcript_38292/m.92044 type:complete len:263 (+) Transcript_38292:1673-2461(+)